MSRIGIIAAAGNSTRTGLSEYTSKFAFRLGDRSLLAHQIDFLQRSGADRAIVVAQSRHARLIARALDDVDRLFTSVVFVDAPSGWAGEVARCSRHFDTDDEVALLSCDNYHVGAVNWLATDEEASFTYATWTDAEKAPTTGTVLARVLSAWGRPDACAWMARSGEGHVGDFFAGYAIARGGALADVTRDVVHGDIAYLLEALSHRPRCAARPYGRAYVDVADLGALARVAATLHDDKSASVPELGAAVAFRDSMGRLLLSKRSDGRGWVPPGGERAANEALDAAALREATEEVGLLASRATIRLLGVYTGQGKQGPCCTAVFRADVSTATALSARPTSPEVVDVGWFAAEEARAVEVPFGLRSAVEDFFADRDLDCR